LLDARLSTLEIASALNLSERAVRKAQQRVRDRLVAATRDDGLGD
jgi:DNA-directed RNA polymerase specialized sigma24 family protein